MLPHLWKIYRFKRKWTWLNLSSDWFAACNLCLTHESCLDPPFVTWRPFSGWSRRKTPCWPSLFRVYFSQKERRWDYHNGYKLEENFVYRLKCNFLVPVICRWPGCRESNDKTFKNAFQEHTVVHVHVR